MHLKNLSNPYQHELGALFDEMPKSVLAAIAVSALTIGGDCLEKAQERAAREWFVLHQNRIVPQKPGRIARRILAAMDIDEEDDN